MNIRKISAAVTAVGAVLAIQAGTAQAQGTLRIGMTAADIPKTHGQPDQGFEGNRFTGIPMFDGLTQWDLSSADKPSVVIPGLATEWAVDATDKTKWIFKLRPGVKFHDGSAFTADAVVWNVEKVLKQDAVHFDASQVSVTASRMPTLRSARKIDDLTVELTTAQPDSFLPINLTNLFMASPTHWQKKFDAVPASVTDPKERAKQAWVAFAADSSGTGPFKMERFVPRERLELVKNTAYYDSKRVPKLDRVVLLPMPEPNARTAALLSGQVDWVEAPAPDALPQIRQRGFVVTANAQPHVWPWQFSVAEGSPGLDKRVRQAANLCVDRAGMKELLGGMMEPAVFSKAKPLTVKVQTSASGSGQMQPLPMNEFIQQNLADCHFKAEIDVIEWNTLFTNLRKGAKDESALGANAINVTRSAMDPFFAMARFLDSKMAPPTSNNWGFFNNPEFDKLVAEARVAFDAKDRDAALAKLHARSVEEAVFLWVAHDVGPRAMTSKVKGYVQPKSWFVDLTTVSMQ